MPGEPCGATSLHPGTAPGLPAHKAIIRRSSREGTMSADRIPSPRHARPEPPPSPAIVFYNHRDVVVTSRCFANGALRYDIADLDEFMHARGSTHPGTVIGLVIAAAEAALLIPLVGVLRAPVTWGLATVALLVPCVVAAVCARRWPPRQELVARYRGRRVTLLATTSEREFGQVARALRRAVEARTVREGPFPVGP